jgi:hypothetical protein
MAENLSDVFNRNKYNLHSAARQSRTWFDQQVLLIKQQQLTPTKVFRSENLTGSSRIVPGYLYMYFYEAKHKDTLPYWDRFPLVFPFEKTKDGFIGLNLHYLPYHLRVPLLDKLMFYSTNKNMDETTKIRFSWATIASMSKYRAAQPCVKRYLNSQVRSPFKKVDASEWATAMMLPVESFVGSNKLQVWEDSKRRIRKL